MVDFGLILLGQVPGVKGSNCLNTDWNEQLPVDHLIFIFISESNQHVDIVVIQSIAQSSKAISELGVREQSCSCFVGCFEHLFKCSFERGNESWRININLLRLTLLST